MPHNHLRELLRSGKPSLGTHVISHWPSIYELVGHSGAFDYVEFLAEEAPYDLHDLDAIGRAVGLFPNMSAMLKVDAALRDFTAARAISSGFHSILFADIRTADDARAAVRCVRPETPADGGELGSKAGRAFAFGACDFEDYVQALRDVVIAVMIEKRQSLENLEDILAVPGIDMVQFGPSDFSMSVGVRQPRLVDDGVRVWEADAAVTNAERRIIETALAAGVQPRAEIKTPAQAGFYLDLGVRHFSLGTDVGILANWLRTEGGALRSQLDRLP